MTIVDSHGSASGHTPAGVRRSARRRAAVWAIVFAVAAAAVYLIFVVVPAGQIVDEAAFRGAGNGPDALWRVASPILDVVSEGFVIVGLVALVGVAVMRRRWVLGLQAVILVVGANLTTQLLKWLLDRPDHGVGRIFNSLPSGHTTVAASVGIALLIVASRRWRPPAAVLAAAYAGVTGMSVLVGQWHRGADAVAAVLVVGAWAAGLCAVSGVRSLDSPRDMPRARGRGLRDDQKYGNTEPDRATALIVRWLLGLGIPAAILAGVAAVLVSLAHSQGRTLGELGPFAYAGAMHAVVAAACIVAAVVLRVRQDIALCESREDVAGKTNNGNEWDQSGDWT